MSAPEKSLGEIAAIGFGYSDWSNVPASMKADFQRAAESVQKEVIRRILEQQRKERDRNALLGR